MREIALQDAAVIDDPAAATSALDPVRGRLLAHPLPSPKLHNEEPP
jgi:hypothetical protein